MKGKGVLTLPLQAPLCLTPGEQAFLTLTASYSSMAPTVILSPGVFFLHTACDSPK